MHFKSKKTSLIILAVTALVCSRAFFALINDPEGHNLLIVVILAGIVYLLSWSAYRFVFSAAGLKRLLLAVATQIIIVVIVYFLLI